jgi:hypothetical protein
LSGFNPVVRDSKLDRATGFVNAALAGLAADAGQGLELVFHTMAGLLGAPDHIHQPVAAGASRMVIRPEIASRRTVVLGHRAFPSMYGIEH